MWFHGARFSNYSAWLMSPTTIKPSSQVVWPIVGQEILNGDVGGGFSGVQVTSGWFQMWRAAGIMNEAELYWTAIGGLLMSAAMVFAGWFHYHKAAPKLQMYDLSEWSDPANYKTYDELKTKLSSILGEVAGMGAATMAQAVQMNEPVEAPSPQRMEPVTAENVKVDDDDTLSYFAKLAEAD
jgi:hypothetical protein